VIETTLAAAGVPRERCGKERTARLQGQELSLYEQVLGAFASTGRPTARWVRERATALGLDPDDAFAALAREDLAHLGTDGEISVAYPFSGLPTRHGVTLGGETEAWAMCAIDALGMAAMLGKAVEVRSRDPVTEEPIEISLAPQGEQQWRPPRDGRSGGQSVRRSGLPKLLRRPQLLLLTEERGALPRGTL
jgi:hypothetical protein